MKLKQLTAYVLPCFLLLLSLAAQAQMRTVTGKVMDAKDGTPLVGASVTVKGGSKGVVTDQNGNFSLKAPGSAKTIVISSVGFKAQEISLADGVTGLQVSLMLGASDLNDVVVIGYGAVRKRDLTGSVANITEKEFNPGVIATPEQLIQGKVAGVEITSNGGAPGSGSVIRIRGGASLNASNDPLIVIDGVPLDNGTINGSPSPLSMVNPQDIASFSVLKDASATAIYGSRASNGVIIITTKKGHGGDRVHVDFSTMLSDQTLTKTSPVMSTAQFIDAIKKYNAPDSGLLGHSNTNWQKQIFRNAITTDNNLSITGGIKNLPYRLSLGYMGDPGILKTGYMHRQSAALNLNPSFFHNSLKVDLNVKGAVTENRFANVGAIGAATAMDPTQPVYSGNSRFGGYYEWLTNTGIPNSLAVKNPVGLLEETSDKSTVKRSIGNINLNYALPFLPELKLNLNTGYDFAESNGHYFQDSSAAANYVNGGDSRNYTQKIRNKVLDFYLNYAKEIKSIHSRVDATAGYSYQDVLREAPAAADYNVAHTNIWQPGTPDSSELTLISFYGRLNYTFRDKYLLTATLRDDGSSRFAPANRWGLFPAIALAWKIKDETFLANSRVISDLKLRLGYGITGNQDIGSYYPYLATYTQSTSTAQYAFGDTYYNTWRPNGYVSNIKWEQQATYNAGIDYGFLNNRISGAIDVYEKKTTNLLSTVPVPEGSNLTNQVTTNVGSMENKGVEFSVNATPIDQKRFTWDLGFNFTYGTRKITGLTLPGVPDSAIQAIPQGGISGGTGTTVQAYAVGYDPQTFYLEKQVYNAKGQPIEGVFADVRGNGTPGLYLGKSAYPTVFLGFHSEFRYTRWTLGFSMRAELGNYVYNNLKANSYYTGMANSTGSLSNASSGLLQDNFQTAQYLSDYFLENASFLRMDNISLGYNFGKVIAGKIGVKLSGTVQNAFTITRYAGLNPEVYGGIDNNFYPLPRIYSLGLNLVY
jgi:TonB-linked SusC/RagA family outer membrane protein